MSDVRSLLKQARQARQIAHPHAKYNPQGTLYCTACTQKIASEALWETHIQSIAHKEKVKNVIHGGQRKAKRGIVATALEDEEEKEEEERRKRLKVPVEPEDEEEEEEEELIQEEPLPSEPVTVEGEEKGTGDDALPADFFDPGSRLMKSGVDEDEWAKFQSEIADVIRRQEDENEDEEELKRGIVEEFEEMNSLEDRVQRLKKRRAELQMVRQDAMLIVPTVAVKIETVKEGDSEEEEEWW
jgi:zinc finger protein 830